MLPEVEAERQRLKAEAAANPAPLERFGFLPLGPHRSSARNAFLRILSPGPYNGGISTLATGRRPHGRVACRIEQPDKWANKRETLRYFLLPWRVEKRPGSRGGSSGETFTPN